MENTQSINENPSVQEMISKIKLLPRDTAKYPDFSHEDQIDTGSFIYAMQTLASGGDGNLTSLVWNLWKHLAISIQSGGLTEELQTQVQDLHSYLGKIGFFADEEAKPTA